MGREIRMVPPNWEHPRYTKDDARRPEDIGEYRSCKDEDYETAAAEWIAEFDLWRAGKHEDQRGKYKSRSKYYWEYASVPDEETCRPDFTEPATWLQVYETVSEGTPVTPPFATAEELVDYLVTYGDFWEQQRAKEERRQPRGHSREAAQAFVKDGYAPSMVVSGGKVYDGIEAAALHNEEPT